jgi:DNA-binding transcriptional LysR family regulator
VDTEVLKTFLELSRTRHFGRTAENLYLTQSAVSARIRLLEQTLGLRLFTRDRHNIQLTQAGARFLAHAEAIVNAWNRATQDTALEEGRVALSIGGMFSIWDTVLQRWLHGLHTKLAQASFQAEAHGQETLSRRLLEGLLDVAFYFDPPMMPELMVREVAPIRLIMVTNRQGLSAHEAVHSSDYIMVDWGNAVAIAHGRNFPDMPPPRLRMNLGRMALAFLLERGGVAYIAKEMLDDYIERERLFTVADAPVIERMVHAAYPAAGIRRNLVEELLDRFNDDLARA